MHYLRAESYAADQKSRIQVMLTAWRSRVLILSNPFFVAT